jgi:hypothetical protein
MNELKSILQKDDQTIELPKGKDEAGDDYWVILNDNEYVSRVYLTLEKDSEMATLAIYSE